MRPSNTKAPKDKTITGQDKDNEKSKGRADTKSEELQDKYKDGILFHINSRQTLNVLLPIIS